MSTPGRELISPNEPTFLAKSFFDPIVVKEDEGNRRFPNPSCTDQSDGFEVF
jgi:hypothetical protein